MDDPNAFYRFHSCQNKIVDRRQLRTSTSTQFETQNDIFSPENSATRSASIDPQDMESLLVPFPHRILTSSDSDAFIMNNVLKNTYLLSPGSIEESCLISPRSNDESSSEIFTEITSDKVDYQYFNSPTNATMGDWSSSRSVVISDGQNTKSIQQTQVQKTEKCEVVDEVSKITVTKMDKAVESIAIGNYTNVGVNTTEIEVQSEVTTRLTIQSEQQSEEEEISCRFNPEEILQRHPKIWKQLDKNENVSLNYDEMSDVTVIVEGRQFFTIKQVLCEHSYWFRTTLQLMDERTKCIVRLPCISAKIFDIIHKWMFLQNNCLSSENVTAISQAAYQLKMPELLEKCLTFIEQNKIKIPKFLFTPLPYPARAGRIGSPKSAEIKRCLILDPKYFQQIIRCPEYFTLNVTTLEKLLSEDNLKINSEIEVFDATVSWLAYDWPNRVIHAQRLLRHVRFACLTNKELISIMYHQKNLPVIALPFCRDLILRNYLYWSAYKSGYVHSLDVPLPSAVPRKGLRKKDCYLLGRWEAAVIIQSAWRGYLVREELRTCHGAAAVIQAAFRSYLCRRWIKECNVQRRRVEECLRRQCLERRKSAIVIQSHFRKHVARNKFKGTKSAAIAIQSIVRGFLARQRAKVRFATIQIKSKISNGTTNLQKMLAEIKCNKLTTTLILLGGYDLSTNKTTDKTGRRCYIYRTHKLKWELISIIPEAIHCCKAAIIDSNIYITGGCYLGTNEITPISCVWKWNLLNGFWVKAADMRHCRIHHALVSCLGRLYAIGGKDECDKILSSVEMYDPDANDWYEVASLLCKRMGHCATTFRDVIAVCGGVGPTSGNRGEILSTMEVYHPYDDKWSAGTTLRFPLCFSTLVEWKGDLFIIGGVNCSFENKGSVSVIDKYDTEEENWKFFIETNIPRHSCAAGVINSTLCVAGGLSSQLGSALSSAYCYDLCTGKKDPDTDFTLPLKLTGMGVVQLPVNLSISVKAVF